MFDLNELDYSKIKLFLLVGLVQILSLAIGFYCGYTYCLESNTALLNYTTKSNIEPKEIDSQKNLPSLVTNNCPIKGSKSKIYHVPNGAFYDRTTPQECFETEQDAQSAGYTKSSK